MPLLTTKGAGSASSLGITSASGPANYIEDVFSCFLYAGTSSALTITNGIDLSTKGGLVWSKVRNTSFIHNFFDTARGVQKTLCSNTTDAEATESQGLTAFNSNGYTVNAWSQINSSSGNFVSWTFRKQPKFFDVVTYTGTGTTAQNISHNLGAVPGCIIIKRTDSTSDWGVVHRSTNAYAIYGWIGGKLNTTGVVGQTISEDTGIYYTNSTTFQVDEGSPYFNPNASGGTYVAYLFAHDAGGFGLSGTDNVISCGSYTGTGAAGNSITLGYEPQWVMVKASSSTSQWQMYDTMRGWAAGGVDAILYANQSAAEDATNTDLIRPTATGFQFDADYTANSSGVTYIYIAIRRGPMKVPTLGTSVFAPATRTGTGTATTITSAGFPVDLVIGNSRNAVSYGAVGAFGDRLRGKQNLLYSEFTNGEDTTNVSITGFDVQNGISVGGNNAYSFNYSGGSFVNWFLRRAPSFFDVVCYTGTGVARTVTHNLGAVPELMIVKGRNLAQEWDVYVAPLGATKYLRLDATSTESVSSSRWNNTIPSSTNFTVGTDSAVNANTYNYVAYLFATCAGVSKVGSYTGYAGYTVTVPCGFTGGVRFVLIKRTDSSGDWWVYDSARGIVSGNDPYLYLNSTAAEVGGTDYIDSYSAGFEVTSTAPAGLNATGGTYIFLAIA